MITTLVLALTLAQSAEGLGVPAVEEPTTNQWAVGARVELDAMGIIERQPAIAPAVFGSFGRGIWGAAVTVIILPMVGVRAEGRVHLLEKSIVRPLFSLGVTVFGFAVAPHGAVGVTIDLGHVRLSLDAAIEYFFTGPYQFEPLAILSSVGVAWRF